MKTFLVILFCLVVLTYGAGVIIEHDSKWPLTVFYPEYRIVAGLDTAAVTSFGIPLNSLTGALVEIQNRTGGKNGYREFHHCDSCEIVPGGLLVPVMLHGDTVLVQYTFPDNSSPLASHLSAEDQLCLHLEICDVLERFIEDCDYQLGDHNYAAIGGVPLGANNCPSGTIFYMTRTQFDRCAAVYDSVRPLIATDIIKAKAAKDSSQTTG